MGDAVKFTSESFEKEVIGKPGVAVVDFWAEWCGPCKMLSPVIDEVAQRYAGKVTVGKINVDESADLATKFGIMSIPTLLFFKDGQIQETLSGMTTKDAIAAKIDALL